MQFDLFDTTSKDIFSAGTYQEFREQLKNSGCAKCPDLCASRTSIVVDRGNPSSKIVLIGEGPGEKEDAQGLAFVGRAGRLLDDILTAVGINTNTDTLILNVVKCRPPDNRAPTKIEADNCRPFLDWQLKFVNPRLIVLLGATAAKYFLPNSKASMKDKVGQLFRVPDYPNSTFMLLYHPAYILRDPRKRPEMDRHARELRRFIDEESKT